MIYLYNHTKHPSAPIKAAVTFAARAIGVKGDVHVKVTRSRSAKPGAWAGQWFPYLGFLKGTSDRSGRNERLMSEEPGYVVLSLPDKAPNDWLGASWWFMECALHEMAHILQFRSHRFGALREREAMSPGRRMAHDKRPVEVDADNQVYDALQDRRRNTRAQDLAIALAIAIEDNLKGKRYEEEKGSKAQAAHA